MGRIKGGKKVHKSSSNIVNKSFLKYLTEAELEEKIKSEAYLGLIFNDDTLHNTLNEIPMVGHDHFNEYLVYLMSRPEYFYFIIKILFGMETFPMQSVMLKELYEHRFPILVAGRGTGKTFTLGLYLLIRMIITPGIKCVITGAGFRQAKLVFEVMESIWNRAPMLRGCFKGLKNGPFHGTDAWHFRLGDSTCYALPVGHDGSKVRGYRANVLVADEFASLSRTIFEEVMSGFLSVSADSIAQMKQNAFVGAKKGLGLTLYSDDKDSGIIQNQLILSGTAYYKHNHFYEYFKKWSEIILSKGNFDIARQHLPEGSQEEDFNWKDYSIMRFPVELIQSGHMDMSQVNRIKVSVNKDIYLREFCACLHPSTKIITKNGPIRIKDIKIGDEVYTHKGRFKKVNKLTYQKTDSLLEMKFYGNNKNLYVTNNHPIYMGEDKFVKSQDSDKIVYSKLIEISNKTELDIRNYVDESEYNQYGEFIRSRHGSTILNNSQIKEIYKLKEDKFKPMEISRLLKIKYSIVQSALKFNSFNKINPIVKLDYYSGLVFGYYAAEGSKGSSERAIGFSLDGHKDKNLVEMVEQLKDAIQNTFNVIPKEYYREDNRNGNCVDIVITNKLITSFMSKVCSGICYNKIMEHNVLFSNEKFMKGFLVGFWNGDGHKRHEISKTQICSENLTTQLRLLLSYFGVPASYYTKKGGISKFPRDPDKTHISSNRFKLEMFKQNNKLFLNTFFGTKYDYDIGQSKYYLENNNIVHKLKSREEIPFNGYVYNIEVDDDNSYHTEFGCVHNCFSDDSDGFYKRSLINYCTISSDNKIIKNGEDIVFSPSIYGNQSKKHVFGVDPAYQGDNFAIVILEINGSHRRVVHCWTTQASDHKQRLKDKVITENNYYQYCVRKMRDLMKRFPCAYIALDKGGGGTAIMEVFADTSILKDGEEAILPVIDPLDDPKDTDFMQGEHILHVIKPTAEWNTEANHSLKKDMETRDIIFPFHDVISYIEAEFYDQSLGEFGVLYDTLEDCLSEIEELKNELSTITISETSSGKEHFDTPEKKTAAMKKGRLRKDRYSALLMANMIARNEKNLVVRQLNTSENAMQAYFGVQQDVSAFLGNGPIAQQLNSLYS